MTEIARSNDPRKVDEPIQIRLEGDGVEAGSINAMALGEALVGITELTRELARTGEYKNHGAPEVRVVGTAEGSFILELSLETLGQWWAAAREVLAGDDATALANLAAFTALLGSVIDVLDGDVDLELDGGEVITVDPEVAVAVQSPRVQRAARATLAPLAHRGVESMTISAETVNITINQVEAAAIPEPESQPIEDKKSTFEAWARFERPDFGGDRWGVKTLTEEFQAVIEDQDFLTQVDNGSVTLGKYSEFRVAVRVEPYLTSGGQTRRRRYITKVTERRDGANDQHPSPESDDQLPLDP